MIGLVGSQALTIFAIIAFLLAPYQTFAYYSDALKSHYFERVKAQDGSDDVFQSDWHDEVRSSFSSRQPFE